MLVPAAAQTGRTASESARRTCKRKRRGAVAVAADEENWHSGQTDASKQSRLLAAGAEFCIPDYAGIDTWLPRVVSRPA